MVKNFNLSKHQSLSKQCIAKGLPDFSSVFNYIKQLPYGRNTNRSDFALVIKENKGTCSTKHAFLKAIATENNTEDITLCLGIFKMNRENTPKISTVLDAYQLEYIPEAHCYLKVNNKIIDITFNDNKPPAFVKSLLQEEFILPEHIGDYKLKRHQSFLKSWIIEKNVPLNYDELWKVRELCIAQLSE
ncbi:hypothetical protein WNY78_14290 [Psychroserpens sp. AS72]|uniref:hypothetical protein n=1 Tax=Psychroserpens sp. AS72 TaxID=3135775 RepID=UPI0031713C57